MSLFPQIVRNIIAPVWALWERSPYLRYARRLRFSQFESLEVVRDRQWQKLEHMVQFAFEHTPFWKKRFCQIGLHPCEIRTPEQFAQLPILTKADLRESSHELLSNKSSSMKLVRKTTSGSTGTSVAVFVDEDAIEFKRAYTLRSDEWSGWQLGELKAAIWGNPEYVKRGWRGRIRNALLERSTYLDTLKMDEKTMTAYHDELRRRSPSLLFGHAHSLYLFAEFVRSRGGAGFRPKGIISTAMVLHDWERQSIEEVFDAPVTNRYGCEEVSLIACQCEKQEGLHINADGVYVETIRPDGSPAAPGEPGRIIVTDLVNHAMPLLRYEVGDVGVLSDKVCSCGRGLPLIDRLEGRVADYVVTSRGELISGISLTENFAVKVPGVEQVQIVQKDLNYFVFRLVRGAGFGDESELAVKKLAKERFGDDVNYHCEYLDKIPQDPSGKYRFCISMVDWSKYIK